ncbi:FtsJ methyltransferase domain-containing protein 2 [Borealophlyctis nickersoniae]|nr:FtsJ methyltransferase domain-containing protein 2 [Borealophlyctis nickersoniae]
MANLDRLFDLTNAHMRTKSTRGFRYADLCAGPGGFTEYILWRQTTRSVPVRGWGITLKGEQDFALDNMVAECRARDRFSPSYGEDGTGNIYNSANIRHFAELVKRETGGDGVDLVGADGGFSISGDEIHQEEQSKQIMLCQVLTALLTLRNGKESRKIELLPVGTNMRPPKRGLRKGAGGDFLFKTFNLFTPFMAELVYILYRNFERVAIIKPYTSRPANDEKYVVCQTLRPSDRSRLIDHLFDVNAQFNKLRPDADVVSSHNVQQPGFRSFDAKVAEGAMDVTDLLDPKVVAKDNAFVSYLQTANLKMAVKQMEGLKDLYSYTADPTLAPFYQIEIRDSHLGPMGVKTDRVTQTPVVPGRSKMTMTDAVTDSTHTLATHRHVVTTMALEVEDPTTRHHVDMSDDSGSIKSNACKPLHKWSRERPTITCTYGQPERTTNGQILY